MTTTAAPGGPVSTERRSRRRAELPAPPAQLARARALGARDRALVAELEALHLDRLDVVLALRAAGCSHQEIADLFGVTKARVQQLVREAEESRTAR